MVTTREFAPADSMISPVKRQKCPVVEDPSFAFDMRNVILWEEEDEQYELYSQFKLLFA